MRHATHRARAVESADVEGFMSIQLSLPAGWARRLVSARDPLTDLTFDREDEVRLEAERWR